MSYQSPQRVVPEVNLREVPRPRGEQCGGEGGKAVVGEVEAAEGGQAGEGRGYLHQIGFEYLKNLNGEK